MKNSERHTTIVKQLIDSKQVDFSAISQSVARTGTSLTLAGECGYGMNQFLVHLYKVVPGGKSC